MLLAREALLWKTSRRSISGSLKQAWAQHMTALQGTALFASSGGAPNEKREALEEKLQARKRSFILQLHSEFDAFAVKHKEVAAKQRARLHALRGRSALLLQQTHARVKRRLKEEAARVAEGGAETQQDVDLKVPFRLLGCYCPCSNAAARRPQGEHAGGLHTCTSSQLHIDRISNCISTRRRRCGTSSTTSRH